MSLERNVISRNQRRRVLLGTMPKHLAMKTSFSRVSTGAATVDVASDARLR
jgi:hypothetical protein